MALNHEVEGSCICRICQVKSYSFAFFNVEPVICLAVEKHFVAKSPHHCESGKIIVERLNIISLHFYVIKKKRNFIVNFVEIILVLWLNKYVAIQSEFLLQILPHMGMIPIDSLIRQLDFVKKAFSRLDGLLANVNHSVEFAF